MRKWVVLASLAAGVSGCANYAPVASLYRQHQTYLGQLETQLSSNPGYRQEAAAIAAASGGEREKLLKEGREARAEWYRVNFGSIRPASVRALSKAQAAKLDTETRPGDAETRAKLLNARLAQIQEEFFQESEADAVRGQDLSALYLKLVEAVRALRLNGEEIQKYLDLGRVERARADVRAMDPEKLKAIGDDLKGLADRLRR